MDLKVFLKGEKVNLCIPTEEFALKSNWHEWFNDMETTRYLDQGIFPNCIHDQLEFLRLSKKNRLILIIWSEGNYLGVASLSNIDLIRKSSHLAIVMDSKQMNRNSPLIALESISLICEHAFLALGLNRIESSHHVELASFSQRMELLGFQLEAIHTSKFVKGREIADTIVTACSYERYIRLKEKRGKYWDSTSNIYERIKNLPRKKFSALFQDFFLQTRSHYYDSIINL